MTFKNLLKEKLENILSKEQLEKLPKGFQRIGDIIILNLHQDLLEHKKNIGQTVLEIFKVRSVCNKTGSITGKFREPQIELLAGDEDTITTHIESGCKYRFDLRKVMFAKGNIVERTRIPKQVHLGEIIIDMFAGIGYFSIPIGVLSKPKKVYSIELNPTAFEFLKENLKINHIHNIEAINGDNRQIIDNLVEKGIKADRIIMGYLPPPKEFLTTAFKISKKETILHYEDLVTVGKEDEDIKRVVQDVQDVASKYNLNINLLLSRKIKSYGPKIDHYVFDFKIS